MRKSTNTIIGFSIFVLLMLVPASYAAETTVQSNSSTLTIRITDAYYLDASGDGFMDDAEVLFNIDTYSNGRTQFQLYFTLTLPSGRQVQYAYHVNTVLTYLEGSMIFHNDATESGWYNIKIEAVLLTGGASYTALDYDFDPPGHTSGGDPDGELTLG